MRRSLPAALVLVLSFALAAPAAAAQREDVVFTTFKSDRQRLTVTVGNELGGRRRSVVATYRRASTKPTSGACAASLAANRDARLIEDVVEPNSLLSVNKTLPLGLYTVCTYSNRSLRGVVVGGISVRKGGPGARRAAR